MKLMVGEDRSHLVRGPTPCGLAVQRSTASAFHLVGEPDTVLSSGLDNSGLFDLATPPAAASTAARPRRITTARQASGHAGRAISRRSESTHAQASRRYWRRARPPATASIRSAAGPATQVVESPGRRGAPPPTWSLPLATVVGYWNRNSFADTNSSTGRLVSRRSLVRTKAEDQFVQPRGGSGGGSPPGSGGWHRLPPVYRRRGGVPSDFVAPSRTRSSPKRSARKTRAFLVLARRAPRPRLRVHAVRQPVVKPGDRQARPSSPVLSVGRAPESSSLAVSCIRIRRRCSPPGGPACRPLPVRRWGAPSRVRRSARRPLTAGCAPVLQTLLVARTRQDPARIESPWRVRRIRRRHRQPPHRMNVNRGLTTPTVRPTPIRWASGQGSSPSPPRASVRWRRRRYALEPCCARPWKSRLFLRVRWKRNVVPRHTGSTSTRTRWCMLGAPGAKPWSRRTVVPSKALEPGVTRCALGQCGFADPSPSYQAAARCTPVVPATVSADKRLGWVSSGADLRRAPRFTPP